MGWSGGYLQRAETLIFERKALLKISVIVWTSEFEGKRSTVVWIEQELERLQGRLDRDKEIELQHFIAVHYFQHGDFRKALKWVMQLRNQPISLFRPDLHLFSWILFLLIHLELENMEVIENSLSPTREYFRKHGSLQSFEQRILKFFKAVLKAHDRTEVDSLSEDLKSDLESTFADPTQVHKKRIFDLYSWVESRLLKTTMSQVTLRES